MCLPAAAAAQEGRIAYSRSVTYDYELPEGMPERFRDQMPTGKVDELLMFFDANQSIMIAAPELERDESGMSERERRMEGFAMRMRMMSSSRSDQEELLGSYVDFATGAMTETKDFLGREFLVVDERPTFAWTLGSEQRQYLDYVVQKATTEYEGRAVEAWFTMQIPVPGGPGPFGGLPGMILLVSIGDGHTVYAASDVKTDGLAGYVIKEPIDGEVMTPEQYEDMVVEKLEELEMMQSNRGGNRRRPF